MYKIKYGIVLFLFLGISIKAYSQRNIVHPLIVSDTLQYLNVDYPEEFTWLIMSMYIYPTISQEKPDGNGYYMFFLADSATLIQQYVSKTKDDELYAKYNPAKEDDSGMCYTIKTTKRGKRRELAIHIHQELEKQLVVSVNVKEKGVYICKSFKPL